MNEKMMLQTPGKVEALLTWLHDDPLRGSICFVVRAFTVTF